MSSSADKTEKPTPRRIQQAREQGQVAKSNDFNSAIVLGTSTFVLMTMGPYVYAQLFGTMHQLLGELNHYARMDWTVTSFSGLLSNFLITIFWILLPFLLAVPAMAILSNLIQVKPLFSVKAIQPKLEKLNPLPGFKRMFATRAWVELLKAFVKMGIIGGCAFIIIRNHLGELTALLQVDVAVAWGTIGGIVGTIAFWASGLFLVLGIIDWRYQAWELEKQLRMTKQEIKDERKTQEGDPAIKQRIRQMGIKIARNKQLAQVPTADVIITNPTHFAIALKYDPDLAPAPVVIAKGVDHFALKIREVAKEHGVMIVENKPLARTLYKLAEVDMMVPPELFVAVAEVLAYVFSRKKGRKLAKRS
ncbi:MAG: flagellar biosynthesis protein FlhB [Candidatus Melainabacteria bacterium]